MVDFATHAVASDELQSATTEAIEAGVELGALEGLGCSAEDVAAARERERAALARMRDALDRMAGGA